MQKRRHGSIDDLIIIITIQKQPSSVSSTDLLHRLYYTISSIMMHGKRSVELGLSIILLTMATAANAFSVVQHFSALHTPTVPTIGTGSSTSRSSSALFLAGGFGGAAADKKKKGASTASSTALKPKQQWDRYSDLKKEDKIRVAIRIVGEEGWLDVGRIKSKENMYTEIAVARQRALIAEVSRKNEIVWNRQQDVVVYLGGRFCRGGWPLGIF
jgi:hypothetical protein